MRHTDIAAVYAAWMGIPGYRPSAHVAWAQMNRSAGIVLERLIIHGIGGDDTVLCLLHFRQGERRWTVDCRPSDGMALALRMESSIVCEEPILALLAAHEDERRKQETQGQDRAWKSYFESLGENIPKA
jgi:hypothetical protein